jgi:chlorobactene glucosyltransferase
MLLAYHIAVTLALAVVLATVAGNLVYLRAVARARRDEEGAKPLVSVLVPARNEAARIGSCLASIAAQRDARIEAIALDDCSEDETHAVVASFAPSVRLLDGEPLPSGWIGKPHACARLAREARGEWLLFVDADVVLAPDAVARALAMARANDADLLTALPAQRTVTLGEQLLIPALYFALAGFLPMFAMRYVAWERLAAASGQFMLFRREAYEAIGGHARVRDRIVEDVELAREIRRAGRRLVIANGIRLASCRMYTSWREIVEGFSKNAFAGIGGSIPALLTVAVVAVALFVAPPIALGTTLAIRGLDAPWLGWLAAETALAVAARLLLAIAFRQSIASVLFNPLAVAAAIAIAGRSFWLTRYGAGVAWRGRRYRPARTP